MLSTSCLGKLKSKNHTLLCVFCVCRGSYTFDQPAIEQGDKLVQAVVTADALTAGNNPVVLPLVTVTVPQLPILDTSVWDTSCDIPNAASTQQQWQAHI
jgi:hypothetical protein